MWAESARCFTRRDTDLLGNSTAKPAMALRTAGNGGKGQETVLQVAILVLPKPQYLDRSWNIMWNCCKHISCAHHERVLHSDNAAVQNGGGDRWDFQHLSVPGLRLARGQRFSPQVSHQLLDLLHLPFGIEGLSLVDGCLWHYHARGAVLYLSKDLDWLSYRVKEKKTG